MRAQARLREVYAENRAFLTITLIVAALLGVYWGYRFIGPLLLG
jgi:hypothetical protein